MNIREYEPLHQTWHCLKCGAENTDDFRRQSAPTCAFCDSAYNWVQVIGNREFNDLTDLADEMDDRDEAYRRRVDSESQQKPLVIPDEPYVRLLRVVEYTVGSCLRTHRWNDARKYAWMALNLRLRIYRARLEKYYETHKTKAAGAAQAD
jgi:hypothetical protein